ncbi:hypothetical protein HN935_01765 [archaeon]|jgi:hypothetical protein|nr:hypothetical protein [archaeon]
MPDSNCSFCGDDNACEYISRTSDISQYAPLNTTARIQAREVKTCNQDKYKRCPFVDEAAKRLSDRLVADF